MDHVTKTILQRIALHEELGAIPREWFAIADAIASNMGVSDAVPIPKNADQAAGMAIVGHAWLKEHAPERLAAAPRAAQEPKCGCHVDLDPGMEPDGCVIDTGKREECVYARRHERKEQCQYWQPIAAPRAAMQAQGPEYTAAPEGSSEIGGPTAAPRAAQEPVAHVVDIDRNCNEAIIDAALPVGTALYIAPRAALPEVWMVQSKTISLLFATEAGAQKFVSSFPPTVGGGMQVYPVQVNGAT